MTSLKILLDIGGIRSQLLSEKNEEIVAFFVCFPVINTEKVDKNCQLKE